MLTTCLLSMIVLICVCQNYNCFEIVHCQTRK